MIRKLKVYCHYWLNRLLKMCLLVLRASVVFRLFMFAQQAPLPGRCLFQHLRAETPVQVRRELLRDHAPAVMHLQHVALASLAAIGSAAVPDIAEVQLSSQYLCRLGEIALRA